MNKYLPFLLVLSLITCCVEVDISVPSFPDISDYYKISDGMTQLTVAINFLGSCLACIFYGPLSDTFGRRRVMIYGNAIMMAGACGCVFSPNIYILLFARLIQGVGAATSAVVAFAMVADKYKKSEATTIIGFMNSLITIIMSGAPVIGSLINEYIGWHGSYVTVAGLSVVSWIMLYLYLPETKPHFKNLKPTKIFKDYKTIILRYDFFLLSITPSLMYAGWMSFVACCSFLYIESYGLSIIQYAIHQATIIGAFCITSLFCSKINKYLGEANSLAYGICFNLIGAILLIIFGIFSMHSPYLTSLGMIVFGIGEAIVYPILFTKSLEVFPNIKGTASSAIMSLRSLICATFVAISSNIYDGTLFKVAIVVLLSGLLSALFSWRILQITNFD